jgi:hypothetical protein
MCAWLSTFLITQVFIEYIENSDQDALTLLRFGLVCEVSQKHAVVSMT